MLAWFARDDARLSQRFRDALLDPDANFLVSSVTAFEFEDLRVRNRFGQVGALDVLIRALNAQVVDYPGEAAGIVSQLPLHHRDPVDRMLVAHAIHSEMPLMTADRTIPRYPVHVIW